MKSASDTDRSVPGISSGILIDVGPDASPEEIRHAFRAFLREQFPNGVATDPGEELEVLKELYCTYRRLLASAQEHAVVPASAGEVVVIPPTPPAVQSRIATRRRRLRLPWYAAGVLTAALLHLLSPPVAPDRVPAAGSSIPSPPLKPAPRAAHPPLPAMGVPAEIPHKTASLPIPNPPPVIRDEIPKPPPVASPGKGALGPAHNVGSARPTPSAPSERSATPVQSTAKTKAGTVSVTPIPAPHDTPPEAAPAKPVAASPTADAEVQRYYLILNKR
ncbi:hypothetical protein [Geobacter pickeringii]|uniref:Uncharacterized protein n=1 Tax=Geobacter pickeringii TaxID=345632 RepID=A0A0B5BDK2_9BACT|nr:hypothetical protein [Geobacter pickeringii]AJE03214.1 hypothetical protein GPICK_07450 [Geobacter pickeringii]